MGEFARSALLAPRYLMPGRVRSPSELKKASSPKDSFTFTTLLTMIMLMGRFSFALFDNDTWLAVFPCWFVLGVFRVLNYYGENGRGGRTRLGCASLFCLFPAF